jgi:hypothetical protein
MESWRVNISVFANSHHYDKEQDPDPHFIKKLNPDPHYSDADPQPRIRIQHFKLNTVLIRIQGFDNQQCIKNLKVKFSFFYQKLQFTYLLATIKLQRKPSAIKREHQALKNMQFLNFCSIFVCHFCPPGSGYGILIL